MPATPANAINVSSAGVVSFDGTATFSESSLTQHSVLVGGASQAITSLSVGATATVLAGSTGADPAFTATPTVTSITFGSGTALSTYAEGTWTPTLLGSSTAGTPSYTTQTGYYRRIGNMVYVSAFINGSLSGASGNNLIGGLPFTIHNVANCPGMTVLADIAGQTYGVGDTMIFGFGLANSTTVQINQQGSTHSSSAVAIINSTQQWTISMVYGI